MLADELRMSSITQEQVNAFKRAIEQEHHVKITLVSGGSVVRGNVTYVRRGALAASREFTNYAERVAQGWGECEAFCSDYNSRAQHKALEALGDALNREDNIAW